VVAVNDTTIFLGPYAVDMNTRLNDSDEDGGPFGNTSVLSGPFNGSATVIGTDTIRYVPSASYTGPDSLLYLTCDNYPLCDTGWFFINVQNPLPVELILFTGKRLNENVYLNWTTLSEKENDYFAVERSSDGKIFEVRGQVKGFGTSVEKHHYKFTDNDDNTPLIYYRLKQYDWNGDSYLSKTIALSQKNTNGQDLSLFPNPLNTDHELIIRSQNIKGNAQLFIYDMTGRKLWNKTCVVEEGKSIDVIQTYAILQSGVYIVSLSSDSGTTSTMLVVK
jgi:Bacterial Ig domain/Secretion system C-terminal sorting domain